MSARVQDIYVVFACPRGVGVNKAHECLATVVGPDAPWRNIGTTEKPTLHQSYNCVGGCGWHGYVVDGELIETPRVNGAAGTVTTLHTCEHCKHPELISVGLSPQVNGGLQVSFQRTSVRRPDSSGGQNS